MQPTLSDGLFCSIRLSATNGVHFGKRVEIAHDRPDGAGRRRDHAGGVYLRHRVAPQRSSSRSSRTAAAVASALARLDVRLCDVLGVAQHFGHAAEACRPRCRSPSSDCRSSAPERGSAAPNSMTSSVTLRLPPAAAADAVDMKDLDRLDLLHRPHAFAHDAFDPFEQLAAEARQPRRTRSACSPLRSSASRPSLRPHSAPRRPRLDLLGLRFA